MRALAVALSAAILGQGCASPAHTISGRELQRIAALPPVERGARVRVAQELSDIDVEPVPAVEADTPLCSLCGDGELRLSGGRGGRVHARPGGHGGGGGSGHVGGGGSGGGGGGGGGDGKGAAIAVLVLAASALVVITAIEASRFDGDIQLHPMHPVHLFGVDGSYEVVPLANLDPARAAWVDHAVVRSTEGPWRELDRAPLWRTGWTYGLYVGGSTLRSRAGAAGPGPAFTVQVGYFPREDVGLLGSLASAWRDDAAGATVFHGRATAELQYLPLAVGGRLYGGGYVGLGGALGHASGAGGDAATRTTTGTGSGGVTSGRALTAGAMVQLAVHTRIALTARLGVVAADGDPLREALFGLSVY